MGVKNISPTDNKALFILGVLSIYASVLARFIFLNPLNPLVFAYIWYLGYGLIPPEIHYMLIALLTLLFSALAFFLMLLISKFSIKASLLVGAAALSAHTWLTTGKYIIETLRNMH